jgi:hypothetical protein
VKLDTIDIQPLDVIDVGGDPLCGWAVWPPPDLMDWIQETLDKPEPDWIIPGIIPAGASVLVSGKAKISFKTWLVYLIVLGFAAEYSPTKLLTPTRTIKTLVIEREDPAKPTANRWRWLLSKFPTPITKRDHVFFWHREQVYIDDPAHVEQVCAFIVKHDIQCVVIDTLAKTNQGDENSTRDMSRTMGYLDVLHNAMRQTGCIIYCHHLRKSGERPDEDIDEAIRGSSALSGFYDVHLALRREGGMAQDWIDLTVRQSTAAERHFQLKWDIAAEHGRAGLEMTELDPDNVPPDKIVECGDLVPVGQKYSTRELAEFWKLPYDVSKTIVRVLVDDGTLRRTGRKVERTGE